jgi:predicted metallo-beta-lactamase superfamily hydrolase
MLNFMSALTAKIEALEEQQKAFESTVAVGTKVRWTEALASRTGTVVDVAIDDKTGAIVYKVDPERLRDRPDLDGKPLPTKLVYPHQNVLEV